MESKTREAETILLNEVYLKICIKESFYIQKSKHLIFSVFRNNLNFEFPKLFDILLLLVHNFTNAIIILLRNLAIFRKIKKF